MWNNQPIIDWISREGRLFEDPVALLDGLMEQLNSNGFEIARMRVALQALHPQVAVWSYTWDRQTGARLREVTS